MTTYSLTPEQIEAAIQGHDLRTYRGWIAAANGLLTEAPGWTAIVEAGGDCCVVKSMSEGKPYISHCPCYEDPNHVYTEDDMSDFDSSAWGVEAWDGMDAEANIAAVQTPVFVALRHV